MTRKYCLLAIAVGLLAATALDNAAQAQTITFGPAGVRYRSYGQGYYGNQGLGYRGYSNGYGGYRTYGGAYDARVNPYPVYGQGSYGYGNGGYYQSNRNGYQQYGDSGYYQRPYVRSYNPYGYGYGY